MREVCGFIVAGFLHTGISNLDFGNDIAINGWNIADQIIVKSACWN